MQHRPLTPRSRSYSHDTADLAGQKGNGSLVSTIPFGAHLGCDGEHARHFGRSDEVRGYQYLDRGTRYPILVIHGSPGDVTRARSWLTSWRLVSVRSFRRGRVTSAPPDTCQRQYRRTKPTRMRLSWTPSALIDLLSSAGPGRSIGVPSRCPPSESRQFARRPVGGQPRRPLGRFDY